MTQTIYSAFRLLFEVVTLAIPAYWAFGNKGLGAWRIPAMVAGPLAIALVWSFWGAPMAAHRLQGYARLLLEVGIYAGAALALYGSPLKRLTPVYLLLGIANACVNHFTGWLV